MQDSRTRLEGAGSGRTTRSLCGTATSGVEGVVVQDGGCGEGAAEAKWGLEEVKLMFKDVRKAHSNARCEEEEWVQLPEEFWEYGKYARLRRWLCGMRKAAAGWEEGGVRREVGE